MEQYDAIVQTLALAAKVEDEGHLNLAKLLRAAADGWLRQAAYREEIPANKAGLASAVQDLTQTFSTLGLTPDLVQAIQRGAEDLAQGRLTLSKDAPPPFVCRTCGHIQLGEPTGPCPTCGAIPATFQQFPPVYWLGAFDPFQALAYLRQTPEQVAALLEGLPDAVLDRQPADGGWAIRHVIAHLRDAQLLVDYRIQLMLAEENPSLEAKAVFEWATQAGERPETVQEILAAYRASRRNTLASLERIPLADWWRSGRHQEFGEVTILQQASYFAMHEVTHLPQLEALKRGDQ
jgi:rubrerythrin